MKIGYCPICGREIIPKEIEPTSGNIYWGVTCITEQGHYQLKASPLKTTSDGYILEPSSLRGRYIYAALRRKV